MRTIGDNLKAHLAGDATTLCHCWRLTRRDGVVLGFTDHDRDLSFGGTLFRAESGYAASDIEAVAGLQAPSGEVAGALTSEAITEADIAAGRYDGAKVEVYLVNWQQPAQHIRLRVMDVGEVTRTADHFTAELRSVAHRLGQTHGRIYGRRCDATFGDARCGVNADDYRQTGSVVSAPDRYRVVVSGLDSFRAGHFRYGVLIFTSGVNDGLSVDIESHSREGGEVVLIFWLPLPLLPAHGDTFEIVAGCDKTFETCRKKFGNGVNFRGFPHVPGTDFAYSYADGETEHDGRPLFD